MARKKWADMTPMQKQAVVGAGVLEVMLTSMALLDLARRESAQVRGPKVLWFLGILVQPVGPIAYMSLGRRK